MRTSLQDQTLHYVRSLERRIQQLEEERLSNNNNTCTVTANGNNTNNNSNPNNANYPSTQQTQQLQQVQQQQQQQPMQMPQLPQLQLQQQSQQPQPQQQQHRQHPNTPTIEANATPSSPTGQKYSQSNALSDAFMDPISGRPEAVVRALQVLEVREQLERDRLNGGYSGSNNIEQMDAGEKALVREMCNVVWRKLEGCPNGPSTLEPL